MPIGQLEKGREKTTLVFDTWANVGSGELLIHWPCELDAEEADLLGKLASSLGYLGRSESWVEAQLTNEDCREWNAVPSVENEHRGPGWEQVSLMAAISPADYEQWREAQVQEALRPFQGQKHTAPVKKKQAQAIEPYPPDLLSCLTKDTAWWKGHGWSQPPGSQRVLYWRRSGALQVGVPTAPRLHHAKPVQFMLLALTTPTGNTAALPGVIRTLPQAELFRQSIISNTARGERIDCPELIGKDEHGHPLHDQHRHAHVIPLALNERGRLDHILIYCESGLSPAAQEGVRRCRKTWRKKGPELQVALVGAGSRDDLRRLPSYVFQRLEKYLGPPEGSTAWVSATPFVPPRFLKPKGKDTLEGQVQAELASRVLPAAAQITPDPELTKALRHFVRRRAHGGVPPKVDAGYGLRLQFSEPIHGPLLLGYASHYGLGLFRAET
jgi:CRISPR-associated protein Csb2